MPDASGRPLLCITPAPAIDRTAHVERIDMGEVLRPLRLVALPGGKGVNAARAAARLGGSVITTGVAGGHAGRWIVDALAREGLAAEWSYAAAESRTTYVTVDLGGDSVIVYERPGPATEEEFEAFLRLLEVELLPRCARAIVAGSIPAGIDARGHKAIVEVCRRAHRPLLVDASGAGLVAALAAQPDIVKIGRIEAVEVGLTSPAATAADAAIALVEAGARLAIVTDGAGEVAAADATRTWHLEVPGVEAVNAVGSGDCFNAALSLALMDGHDLGSALIKGVAAGSANALTLGAAMLDPEVAGALEPRISLTTQER
jgi:tagatose 6-phosphate kinase